MANCIRCGGEMRLIHTTKIGEGIHPNSGIILKHNGHPVLSSIAGAVKLAGKFLAINEYWCANCDVDGFRIERKK